MGCGCKKGDEKSPEFLNHLNKEVGGLNIKGELLKIPLALFYTILMILLSPFLLIFIWYLVMTSAFGNESNIINLLLWKFKKKPSDNLEEDLDGFNEGDYEIINVDIVK